MFFWLKMLDLKFVFPHFKAVLKVTNAYPNWQNSLSEKKIFNLICIGILPSSFFKRRDKFEHFTSLKILLVSFALGTYKRVKKRCFNDRTRLVIVASCIWQALKHFSTL